MKTSKLYVILLFITLIFAHIDGIGQKKFRLCLQNINSGEKDYYDIGVVLCFDSDSSFYNLLRNYEGGKIYKNYGFYDILSLDDILDNPYRLALTQENLVPVGQKWISGQWVVQPLGDPMYITNVGRIYVEGHYQTIYETVFVKDTIDISLIKAIGFQEWGNDKFYKLDNNWMLTVSPRLTFNMFAKKPVVEWVDIPAGTFIMGSPESEVNRYGNETQHPVSLSAYKISKYEITVAQFKEFIDATGYITDAEAVTSSKNGSYVWTGKKWEVKEGVNWKCDVKGKLRPKKEYNHPVTHVSWNDANAFAEWMGCRLPTEAKWEYACRAGTKTPFNTGNNLTTSQANYYGNYPYNNNAKGKYRKKTLPVGSFPPNAWGLYDMHGNVLEWCSDRYDDYTSFAQTNPIGPLSGTRRIDRGGGWNSDAGGCRSAYRDDTDPNNRFSTIGFRLVSDK